MKKILVTVLITAIVAGGIGYYAGMNDLIPFFESSGGSAYMVEDIMYENPEDVVVDFFEALDKGDTEKVLKMFGNKLRSENYDMEKFIKRLQSFGINTLREIPNQSELFAPISYSTMNSRQNMQLTVFLVSLLIGNDAEIAFDGSMLFYDDNKDVIDDVLDAFEEDSLEDLELQEVYYYEIDSERNEKNYKEMAEIYDCDTILDVVAVFEYDKEEYVLTMMLMESDDGYFISSLNSNILGTSIFPIPGLLEDWEDTLDDDSGIGEFEQIWEK